MDTGLKRAGWATGLLVGSSLAWTVNLGLASLARHDGGDVVLMAVSLWLATVASTTGILIARARWARRLSLAVAVAQGFLALLIPVDLGWGVAVVLTALSAIAAGGPWLDGVVRGRPSASGPPGRVVVIALILLGVPFAVGAVGNTGPAGIAVSVVALVITYWFIRALPGALVAVRLVWPLAALGVAPVIGLPGGIVTAVLGLGVGFLAWHPTVRNSIHPLVETGTRVPIPPELAPREVLDAADIDDRGRPR